MFFGRCPCIFYDPVSDTIRRRGGYRGIFRDEGVDTGAHFRRKFSIVKRCIFNFLQHLRPFCMGILDVLLEP